MNPGPRKGRAWTAGHPYGDDVTAGVVALWGGHGSGVDEHMASSPCVAACPRDRRRRSMARERATRGDAQATSARPTVHTTAAVRKRGGCYPSPPKPRPLLLQSRPEVTSSTSNSSSELDPYNPQLAMAQDAAFIDPWHPGR
ncbi:hypothetical protein Y032_0048g1663 [Ancylostoma ceylanicum]|uniref:Uncharacterized protein n=1 Tax=Ancylostoma ceylanicum TaxID=53326 RepID=A0A016UBJ0_9BILA|nr:hypothetical protein Y032_0048g1663 [Ancylostoma ceylanicum]